MTDDEILEAAEDWATSRDPIDQDRGDYHILKAVGVARRLQDDLRERDRMLAVCRDHPREEDAERIGVLETEIAELRRAPVLAPKQAWLPIDVKVCEVCGYRKHPSGTYDRDGKWPHWCAEPRA